MRTYTVRTPKRRSTTLPENNKYETLKCMWVDSCTRIIHICNSGLALEFGDWWRSHDWRSINHRLCFLLSSRSSDVPSFFLLPPLTSWFLPDGFWSSCHCCCIALVAVGYYLLVAQTAFHLSFQPRSILLPPHPTNLRMDCLPRFPVSFTTRPNDLALSIHPQPSVPHQICLSKVSIKAYRNILFL